ncbi:glycosyltransferase family 4 protein [Plasticicumulans acidivorans]|uniref:Glycosyltransferase involved in cell wall biosynthesis n=1 Tax=Plasticicumulans acidivorans TaxID=886464 RepID=A0A317N236_9GAMM|nr:glycosyltransferase family 1 protein [Plasticicumulans acidivorans]PWV63353.1 glycosyltransferase involved in cell wall biosynthesis [Plasticicumulans acidivorans]
MQKNELKIGIFEGRELPQSFRVYFYNVVKFLPEFGITPIVFSDSDKIPEHVNLLWDVRSGGGNPPLAFMVGHAPLVVTVHGFAPITLSGREYFNSFYGSVMSPFWAYKKKKAWKCMSNEVAHVIVPSFYTKTEVIKYIGLPEEKVTVCHHGVQDSFFENEKNTSQRLSYFFHISNNEPRKNVDRVVRAFLRLRQVAQQAELVLRLPPDESNRFKNLDGINIIDKPIELDSLIGYYQKAMGFVFPSLYEGFGLPILEAMASGCPVITSDVTACPEVAGDAALIVSPRDEDALFEAMHSIFMDQALRSTLINKGIQQAAKFSWRESARKHADVFHKVCCGE